MGNLYAGSVSGKKQNQTTLGMDRTTLDVVNG